MQSGNSKKSHRKLCNMDLQREFKKDGDKIKKKKLN